VTSHADIVSMMVGMYVGQHDLSLGAQASGMVLMSGAQDEGRSAAQGQTTRLERARAAARAFCRHFKFQEAAINQIDGCGAGSFRLRFRGSSRNKFPDQGSFWNCRTNSKIEIGRQPQASAELDLRALHAVDVARGCGRDWASPGSGTFHPAGDSTGHLLLMHS